MTRPMTRTVWVGTLMFGLMLAITASSQQPIAKVNPLPSDLSMLPHDAGLFVSARVADVWATEAAKPIRQLLTGMPNSPLKLLDQTGLKLESIERVSLLIPALDPGYMNMMVVVTTTDAYDRAKLLAGLGAKTLVQARTEMMAPRGLKKEYKKAFPTEEKFEPKIPPKLEKKFDNSCDAVAEDVSDAEPVLYLMGPREVLVLLDDKSFVLLLGGGDTGSEAVLIAQLLKAKKQGALTDAFQAVGQNHHLVVGVNPAQVPNTLPKDLPPVFAPFGSLLNAKSMTLTFDLDAVSKLNIAMRYADAAMAKKASKTIDALRVFAVDMMPSLLKDLSRDPAMKAFLPFAQEVEKGLDNATVEVNEDRVLLFAEMKFDKALTSALKVLTQQTLEAAKTAIALNNLKQIGLALHNYHDSNNMFPAMVSPNSKHPVSWRVMILPYIEQNNLAEMYKYDEPWDSDNNKKLIPLMPKVYELADGTKQKEGRTFFRVFQGPQTIFPLKGGARITEVVDGTSNTVMVVEAAESVEWTRPDDLVFDPKKPLPKLGGHFPKGTLVLMADGSVRTLPSTITEKTWRLLLDRGDGNVVPELYR